MKEKYKPILKNKQKILKRAKTISKALISIILSLYFSYIGFNFAKPLVNTIALNSNVEYFGASRDYIGKGPFGLGYPKFVPRNKSHIKVVVTDKIDDRYYEQFKIYYDYLNGIFEIIDPKYHFELSRGDSNYDILIDSIPFSLDERFSSTAIATETPQRSPIDLSRTTRSIIFFNGDNDLPNARVRYALAHEMMHTLLGSHDIRYADDGLPATIFGYNSFSNLTYDLIHYDKFDNDEANQKIQDEFMIYLPYDLSAIISAFAKKSNREACTKLLNETLEQCKNIFGDDLKYFPDGYQLPKTASDEMSK